MKLIQNKQDAKNKGEAGGSRLRPSIDSIVLSAGQKSFSLLFRDVKEISAEEEKPII